MPSSSTPIYELYGEFLSGTQFDPIHHETIRERSIKHGWTIKQHRHKTLAQVFFFNTAGVRIRSNETDYVTTNPTILVMPPMVRHGFLFPKGIVGDVISIPLGELTSPGEKVLEELSSIGSVIIPQPEEFPEDLNWTSIRTTIAQMAFAFEDLSNERNDLLRSLTNVLLLSISRISKKSKRFGHVPAELDMTNHELKVRDFRKLVETNFFNSKTIVEYAAELGISSPHLNRICNKILKCTPNDVVTSRRIVEAKRLLEYTQHSIADISQRAGYQEPAYFNRSFKREVGSTPGAFRKIRWK